MKRIPNTKYQILYTSASPGFSLVEAVIASAICLAVLLGASGAFTLSLRASLGNTARIQASFLEEEGLEAMRTLRDNGWAANIATLTASTTYYLAYSTSTNAWSATTTNRYIDSTFSRSFVLYNVNRDGSQNIVTSGGSNDANTKKITVTVSWRQREASATSSHSLSTYFTNIFNN